MNDMNNMNDMKELKNKITDANLPDMQKTKEGFYKKRIQKVGVRNIPVRLPLKMKNGSIQDILFTVSSYCSLDKDTKGINMSRIGRTLNDTLESVRNSMQENILNLKNTHVFNDLEVLARDLKEAHGADDVYVKAKGVFMLNYKTPMSNIKSQQPVNIVIETSIQKDKIKTLLTAESSEMSLCPCSREMSLLINNITNQEAIEISKLSKELQDKLVLAGFGAHNQRSHIKITVELNKESKEEMWIEDLKNIAEKSSSQPTFTILKRPDEKFLTECSYTGGFFDDSKKFNKAENTGAKFVEDIARDCAKYLDEELDRRILDYVVVVNNEESIHSSDIMATAVISAGRRLS